MIMVASATYIFLSVLFGIVLIRKYKEKTWNWCRNKVLLEGKTVLITGANSGIGYETAKELAKRKAHIILACKNMDRAATAIEKIKRHVQDCDLVAMQLDLSNLRQIRNFATEVQAKYPKIDILINNAGVYYPMELNRKTADGFEAHFGINHLGHFLLTNLLLENLKRASPSRIIVVSSLLHESGKIDINNLNLKEFKKKFKKSHMNPGYAKSKLENVYFARELSSQLKSSSVDVYTVCPGFTYTALFRDVAKWYHYILFVPVALLFMRTARQGAQTVIYCATEPSLTGESGLFYRNCAKYTSKLNFDPKLQAALWQKSMEFVGIK